MPNEFGKKSKTLNGNEEIIIDEQNLKSVNHFLEDLYSNIIQQGNESL